MNMTTTRCRQQVRTSIYLTDFYMICVKLQAYDDMQ